MKKIISLLLVIALLCGAFPQLFIQAKAYPETYPLPILTGDMALDTAKIAESQLGYAYNDGTAYGAWWSTVTNWGYDYTRLDWCAMFACWCAAQAGAGMGVAYSIDGAKASMLFAWQQQNCVYDTTLTATPQPGDFMYFGGSDRIPNHVAIVTAYDPETKTVYMVGGNQGNSPGEVTTTSCPWYPGAMRGSKYVLGFGRPNYGGKNGCSHQYAGGVYRPETDAAPAMNTYTCSLCGFAMEKPVGIKSGTCGGNTKWTLDDAGTLTVYGTGPMANYRLTGYADSTAPFFGLSAIKQVKIKSGVTSVGDYAFFRQTGLKTLVLPGSLTAIGAEAFSGCTALSGVKLPYNLQTIGRQAFNGCDGLTEIAIPDSVTTVGQGAFLRCRNLTQAVIGTGVTAVEDSVFSGCFSLRDVTLHFSTKKIGYGAFSGCSQLKTVQYRGTQAQWKATQISGQNDRLKSAGVRYAAVQGWLQTGNSWRYYQGGKAVTGWLESWDNWYYFGADGNMVTGWLYTGGHWYFFDSDGKMQTGWVQDAGKWYFMDEDGHMVKGWRRIYEIWYYFRSSGDMATGWVKVGSTWYYLQSSGAMHTGWLKIGTTWYYFHGSGAMATGTVQISGKSYRFDTSGACQNP